MQIEYPNDSRRKILFKKITQLKFVTSDDIDNSLTRFKCLKVYFMIAS